MKFYPILLFFLSLFFSNCSSTTIDDVIPDNETSIDEVTPIDEPETEEASRITYDANIRTIIDNSCNASGCHAGPNPEAGLPLTTFEEVRFGVQNRPLLSRINDPIRPMPQAGLLAIETRELIQQWETDGLLEN